MRRSDIQAHALERRLEGPGSAARLRRINAKFRAASKGVRLETPKARRRGGRLGLTLWLHVWAACAGAALYLMLGR